MPKPRKRHSPDFKARVALEAIRGLKTTAQLASESQVHPVQISQWKRQAFDHLPEAFGREASRTQRSETELTTPLFGERTGYGAQCILCQVTGWALQTASPNGTEAPLFMG